MRSTQRFACHRRLLHECINAQDLVAGRPAHSLIISENLETVALLGGLLIRLFGLCGSLLEANLAFSKLPNPDVITWHAIISAHEIHGEYGRALELYQRMQQEGTKPDRFIFTCVLKACGSIQNLEQGMRVHEQIAKVGIDSDVAVGSTLVDMYAKCDCMEKAHEVFENLRSRNVVTWGAIIDGSVQHGHGLLALELYAKMLEEGIEPNKVIFLSILKACGILGDLGQGKLTHDQILRSRLELEIAVRSTLIDMYAKCGSLNEAENLFKKLPNQDVVSCGAMISGYIQHGRSLCALKFFARMQHEGVHSNKTIFTCILKACGSIKALEQGRVVHDKVTKQGVESDVVVGSALVDMYAKCECLDEACEVFEHMPRRNSVSWGAMIAGYAQHDYGLLALEFFERMQKDGIVPSSVTFLSTVKACVTLGGSLLHGKLIHTQMIGSGLELDVATGTALVDMYAKCGSIKDALKVFDKLPERNVVSWCAMIWGYAEHGQGLVALEHFEKMHEEGLKPNKAVFLSALKACECSKIVYHGRLIHERIIKSGLELDMIIGSALVDMYARYGSLAESRKVFDGLPKRDVVAWGAMIAGYAQHHGGHSAIELFEKMQLEGLKLDKTMASSVLKACTGLGAVVQGMVIHHQIIQDGFDLDCVVRNSLVDMYAKCGSVQDAEKLFSGFSTCDVVSWGAMIGAYAQHGLCLPALELFEAMQLEGIQPNNAIFQSILKACGSMGAIQQGRQIHEQIIRSGFDSDEAVSNALIDMYVKCGSLEQAYKLFNNMRMPDVMSWGALIVGCVQHGFALPAFHLYGRMREQGIEGNKVILPCIVKACGMTGATGQGMHIHDYIIRTGLEFDVVIGSTLVGMYAKVGRLDEARKVLDSLRNRDVMSWSAIIAGYVDHGKFKLAKQCLEEMQHDGMQPHCVTYTSILAACTHAGNVEECHQYYSAMTEEHAISPTVEHLNCMINLLGDAGYLNEAEQLLHTMPISLNTVGWTTLLGACNKYGIKGLGRQCFDQVVLQDPNMASSYVLMSNIYSDVHNEQEIR